MTVTQYLEVVWIVVLYVSLTAAVIALALSVYRDDEVEVVESGGELIDLSAVDFDFQLLKESEPALLPAQYKITHRPQRRVK